MRASPETIRLAILHPERFVRETALHYFTDSHSDDTAMPALAIEALQRYGRTSAFVFAHPVRWPQTEATLDWALSEFRRPWEGTANEKRHYFRDLSRLLAMADVRMIGPRAAEALQVPGLLPESRELLQERLRLAEWDDKTCWAEIHRFCLSAEKVRSADELDLTHAALVVEALSRLGPQQGKRALGLLQAGKPDYPPRAALCLNMAMIELVGRQRVPAAVPLLVPHLGAGSELLALKSVEALRRIATPEVVAALRAGYHGGGKAFRQRAAELLGDIHPEGIVEALLALLPRARDSSEQMNLHQALQGQFCTEGIEPTRQYLLGKALTPDLRDLRCRLVAVCSVLGANFPEYEAWLVEGRSDAEKEALAARDLERRLDEAGGDLELMLERLHAEKRARPGPGPGLYGGRRSPSASGKTGRNDPCPCGSGKKFKHCCLHQQE